MLLSDEQQFPVLRQWPESVVDDQFQLVDLVTDLIELRLHLVVVGNGLVVLVLNLVGEFTGVASSSNAFISGFSSLACKFRLPIFARL